MKQGLTNNPEFFIFRSFKLSFFLFSSLTFFQHSHDLRINMFSSLMQIEMIAEESTPWLKYAQGKLDFNSETLRPFL